jgi:hypothetical protein
MLDLIMEAIQWDIMGGDQTTAVSGLGNAIVDSDCKTWYQVQMCDGTWLPVWINQVSSNILAWRDTVNGKTGIININKVLKAIPD